MFLNFCSRSGIAIWFRAKIFARFLPASKNPGKNQFYTLKRGKNRHVPSGVYMYYILPDGTPDFCHSSKRGQIFLLHLCQVFAMRLMIFAQFLLAENLIAFCGFLSTLHISCYVNKATTWKKLFFCKDSLKLSYTHLHHIDRKIEQIASFPPWKRLFFNRSHHLFKKLTCHS